MSFQAYLDTIEKMTGKTPNELLVLAKAKGFNADTKVGEVVDWLKEDFELGRGHAMAFFHVLKMERGLVTNMLAVAVHIQIKAIP